MAFAAEDQVVFFAVHVYVQGAKTGRALAKQGRDVGTPGRRARVAVSNHHEVARAGDAR